MTPEMVDSFLVDTFGNPNYARNDTANQHGTKLMDKVEHLFKVSSIGNEIPAANNTAWGILNAVTEYTDHWRGTSQDSRVNQAWFGTGARLKQKAWNNVLKFAA